MKTTRRALTVGVLLAAAAQAEVFLLSDALDGSGELSTNAVVIGALAYAHVSAGAQPGGIGSAAGGPWVNRAGFLQAADIKRPGADTDGDGMADELDRDNDNDGLSDTAEVSGSAFGSRASTDPNAADTDADGMDDSAEAAGMYDPNDPGHCLKIVDVASAAGELTLTWIGKGGHTTNTVVACADLRFGAFTNVVSRAPYAGGVAPWYKTTNTWHGPAGDACLFYRVQTSP